MKFRNLLFTALAWVAFSIPMKCITIEEFARAIARTEGFYARGTIPARLHNPGDLKRHGKYVRYHNDFEGFAALYAQIGRMPKQRTIEEVGRTYASDRRWPRNVAKFLGVNPTITLNELFGLAPEYDPAWGGGL